MLALFDRPNSPLKSLPPEARAKLGTPRSEITHNVTIEPWRESKRAAIAAHRTQTAEGGPLAGTPPEVREWQLSTEYFVRAPLPWFSPADEAASDIIAVLAGEQHLG
jgi:LmbE family N-acetylglucosaminyl deacetylase